ncbi:MAG: sugar-binding transcriptional regulator [Lachnospiraceae bacterium]
MDIDKLSEKERYDVLTDIADKYYNQGQTQSEIADYYDTNRFKVAKLLQDAKNEQIIEIHIKYSNERNTKLEKELKERFPLNKALVVNTQYSPYIDSLRQIGKTGADYVKRILPPNSWVGITWGKTLYSVISQISETTHNPIDAVQLTGCTKLANPVAESRELVRTIAAAYYGTYHYLDAPLYVQTPELKQCLMSEPCFQSTIKASANMTAIITGIGSRSSLPLTNPLFSAYMTEQDLRELSNCAGSIYGYVLNNNGQVADIPLNQKVIATPIEQILKTPHRLAVVYGRHKAEITYKALNNHLINEILTDTDTALNLLEYK